MRIYEFHKFLCQTGCLMKLDREIAVKRKTTQGEKSLMNPHSLHIDNSPRRRRMTGNPPLPGTEKQA